MDKEDIKTCKEEAENYIEFMETAGDNAGWTRGLMWYIQYLEQKETILDKVTDKLKEDIKIYGNPEERKQMCKEQLYENDGKWFHAREILNIIEGEKK